MQNYYKPVFGINNNDRAVFIIFPDESDGLLLLLMADFYDSYEKGLLGNCTVCPRNCGTDRLKGTAGYCMTGAGLNIASVCIHRGEEPPVSGPEGICNIFFAACNLKCIYCQNHDISRPGAGKIHRPFSMDEVLDFIEESISSGVKGVGFVSPSHVVPQTRAIIRAVKARGLTPVIVYNTNGYDKASTLRELEGMVDVYLPDFKYAGSETARLYSDADDYPDIALKALREMYYQKGSSLHLDDDGVAVSGILIRHLVLPGHADESIKVLRIIADELSAGVHISLMSQYHPTFQVRDHPVLNRPLYMEEYRRVVEEMEKLGFRNGWIQDPESFNNYLPDFSREHPFE